MRLCVCLALACLSGCKSYRVSQIACFVFKDKHNLALDITFCRITALTLAMKELLLLEIWGNQFEPKPETKMRIIRTKNRIEPVGRLLFWTGSSRCNTFLLPVATAQKEEHPCGLSAALARCKSDSMVMVVVWPIPQLLDHVIDRLESLTSAFLGTYGNTRVQASHEGSVSPHGVGRSGLWGQPISDRVTVDYAIRRLVRAFIGTLEIRRPRGRATTL